MREAEWERYRALVEHSADAIVLLDGEGTIAYVNETGATAFGDSPDALVGRHGSRAKRRRMGRPVAVHLDPLRVQGRDADLHRLVCNAVPRGYIHPRRDTLVLPADSDVCGDGSAGVPLAVAQGSAQTCPIAGSGMDG